MSSYSYYGKGHRRSESLHSMWIQSIGGEERKEPKYYTGKGEDRE